MKNTRTAAIAEAFLAAVFYAVNMPASKALLGHIAPTIMAGLLYLGAGIGIWLLSLTAGKKLAAKDRLSKADLPYTIGMIVLDIIAPICLMLGLSHTTSANASLLNNFEIVATALLALALFHEAISRRLWGAILLVTASSCILSFEGASSFHLSWGSLLVLLAATCWGLENNCTRKIASKDTFEIVTLKGIFSGSGSLMVGFLLGERLPPPAYGLLALLLGFVAYGLSIYFYIRAQHVIGAARTSAYYAVAPFVGALLSFVFLREPLSTRYFIALGLMFIGSLILVADTLIPSQKHS